MYFLIEYDPLIEQYKKWQGLHVVLYNNPSSSSVLAESIVLVALGFGLNLQKVLLFLLQNQLLG